MPVNNPALLSQIHLSGESDCAAFKPHPLKANFCTGCSKLINKHSSESIPNDDCLLAAIEFSQKGQREASCIIPGDESFGGLYHGGFKSVMNEPFLQEKNIRFVVNTAKGLEIFGPKYSAAVKAAKEKLHIEFLELNWEDTVEYAISDESLITAVKFIHDGRKSGNSVLVHCAQGKSRSATVTVGYLMASQHKTYDAALKMVQEQRKMAEPNPSFEKKLKSMQQTLNSLAL